MWRQPRRVAVDLASATCNCANWSSCRDNNACCSVRNIPAVWLSLRWVRVGLAACLVLPTLFIVFIDYGTRERERERAAAEARRTRYTAQDVSSARRAAAMIRPAAVVKPGANCVRRPRLFSDSVPSNSAGHHRKHSLAFHGSRCTPPVCIAYILRTEGPRAWYSCGTKCAIMGEWTDGC